MKDQVKKKVAENIRELEKFSKEKERLEGQLEQINIRICKLAGAQEVLGDLFLGPDSEMTLQEAWDLNYEGHKDVGQEEEEE